ncbi:MAG: hypothetical protein ACFBSC_07070 [Microcoleaceae cyanobacterium]
MGKFTESLSDTSQQLQQVKQGIRAMQELGQEMLDNTFNVAEAGLRTGYAYAKAEDGETIPQQQKLLQPTSNVLDQELLNREEFWTQKSLKARFGKHYAAYRYLK